jgi:hypothetical protein
VTSRNRFQNDLGQVNCVSNYNFSMLNIIMNINKPKN